MPWEKTFELDDAVDRATDVFWAKGYEATSISDLVDGMGINKGSLYNAFGSKKDLFIRVLLKYDQDHKKQVLAELDELDDPIAAISTLFDGLIDECMTDPDKKGCLLINTALDLPNQPDDVKEMVTAALTETEHFFKRALKRGQKQGAIPATIKANDAAKGLMSMLVGLRVLARGVFDVADLRAVKRDALRLIAA